MSRKRSSTQSEETFVPHPRLFQKTPISILEELFPSQTKYSWAVAKNVGCADLFRCRVTVPNKTNGEGISFSKKVAKHQAALDALRNFRFYSQNGDMETFIKQYVCCGSDIFDTKMNDYDGVNIIENRGRSLTRNSHRRSRSRTRSMHRSGSEHRIPTRTRSRSRSTIINFHDNWNGRHWEDVPCDLYPNHSCNVVNPYKNPIEFLKEECRIIGKDGPVYSPPIKDRRNLYSVFATLGAYSSQGLGRTPPEAKHAAAKRLIGLLFFDDDVVFSQ